MRLLTALLLSMFLCSCPGVGVMDPQDAATWQALTEAEADAGHALAQARLTPEPEDDSAAAASLKAAQEALADLEGQIIRKRAGPIVAFISNLAGPIGAAASPFLLGLLPLVGPRGRKHYKRVLTNLIPGLTGTDGSKGISPVAAGESLLRGLGVLHSSEASAAADKATEPVKA